MYDEKKFKHLSIIQGVITRMGQNSFYVKGWTVGIMIAIFSFYGKQTDSNINILVTILPTTILWILDSYYLLLERKFRLLYDEVRKSSTDYNYDMNFNKVKLEIGNHKKVSLLRVLFSISESLFYIMCILTTIFVYILT